MRAMTTATDGRSPVPASYLQPVGVYDVGDQIARRPINLPHVFEPAAAQWHAEMEGSQEDDVMRASLPYRCLSEPGDPTQ